ncbi:Wzz/FepE/Etk N-terminal domain-containing protein [Porticoccaceae bacterium]|nr:Wzz/FepE/Etk N-terminal domain-containing protein [Porticoccaceae bacterium]
MDDTEKSLLDYLDMLRRRKRYIIIAFPLLLAISTAVTFLLPPIYQSEGVILIESQEIPQDLVRSTVTSYAEQQIQVIKQRILTTSRILETVDKYKVYQDERDTSTISLLVDKFRSSVNVEMINANVIDPIRGRPQRASIAFKVSFLDESPDIAQKVANELVTMFLDENVKTRTSKAADTVSFLSDEADKMQKTVQALEEKIADFKLEFGDSLPELLQFNLSMISNLEEKIRAHQSEAIRLNDQIHYLSLELASMDPYVASNDGVTTLSSQVRLAQLQSELNSLENKYSDSHPDIKRLNREIEGLQKEVAADSLFQPEQDMSEISNPLYRQIKIKIDVTEKELARTNLERQKMQGEVLEYHERVSRTHEVQRSYDDMTRDYENTKRKYQELRAKQFEADVAQNLESENKAESFTLIEPPLRPTESVKPNRPKLLMMGLFLSGAISVGLVLLAEMLDPAVRSIKDFTRITGAEPLALIPLMLSDEDYKKKSRSRKRLILFAGLIIVAMLFIVHYFVISLDIVWFKIMAKINML